MIRATVSSTFPSIDGVLRGIVERHLKPAVERSVEIVAEAARELVHVDTGELRASIGAGETVERPGMIVGSVEATAEHAAYNEFGTGIRGAATGGDPSITYSPTWPGMVAIPFMRPALDTSRPRVLAEFNR